MEEIDKIVFLCNLLKEKEAKDITFIDLKDVSSVLKFYILATVDSSTHAKTIIDELYLQSNNLPFEIVNVEGANTSPWRVVDLDEGFLHIFTKEEREKYNLEKLSYEKGNILSFEKLLKKQEKFLEKQNNKK